MPNRRIAIVGTVGVPGKYGGFETLAENLVRYHAAHDFQEDLTVYCEAAAYPARPVRFLSARLRYVHIKANGPQSIPYDIWSLLHAAWHGADVILLLGVSGAMALPLLRLVSRARIVTNIDGIEWKREKWQGMSKRFLRFSEKMAVRFSHEVIADNAAIATYIQNVYNVNCHVIAYGGDHAVNVAAQPVVEFALPEAYAFSVCRVEPENNVHIILEAFARKGSLALVMVGNWTNSEYGRGLRARYAGVAHLHLLDPVYDLGKLKSLRAGAALYVHGHSAGGTNPSLVEAMHFGLSVLAFDCDFNRATTEGKALFFADGEELLRLIESTAVYSTEQVGWDMLEIARRRYTWDAVAREYFALLSEGSSVSGPAL